MPMFPRRSAGALMATLAAAPLAALAVEADPGAAAPEPYSLWLLGLALVLMVWFGWRSRR